MERSGREIDPSSARLPGFGSDWRLLLPSPGKGRMLLINPFREDGEPLFSSGEMLTVICHPKVPPDSTSRDSHQVCFTGDPARLPFGSESFDIVAAPFGFASSQPEEETVSHWAGLLKPGGALLVGMRNPLSLAGGAGDDVPGIPLRRLKYALRQAGLESVQPFGVAPDLLKPAWFLPLTSRATGFFLRRRVAGKPGARLMALITRFLPPSLAARFLNGYLVVAKKGEEEGISREATAAPLIEDIPSRLEISGGREMEWLIQTNGDSDPFDSVILTGFEGNSRAPVVAVKVPRLAANITPLRTEYQSLSQLWFLLGREAEACLPTPLDWLDANGQPALAMSFIQGDNLSHTMPASFWQSEARVVSLVREAGGALRSLHEAASMPIATGENPDPGFRRKAESFTGLFSLSGREAESLLRIVAEIEAQACRARRRILTQGDFWHGNLIRVRGSLVFMDWQFARWSADVTQDFYLFLLAAAISAYPNGSPAERAHRAADLLARWRERVIPAYQEAYGLPEGYVLLPPRAGMQATCVDKATRPALEFGYSHPDDVMWRSLYSEIMEWPEDDGLEGEGA